MNQAEPTPVIDWITLRGAALQFDPISKRFVLDVEGDNPDFIVRAKQAGFVTEGKRTGVLCAPISWYLARTLAQWPEASRVRVEHSRILWDGSPSIAQRPPGEAQGALE